eukprot:ANDGO_02429.mRNA.1 hypothetical protein
MVFCVKLAEKGPQVVREVCELLGWQMFDETKDHEQTWNLWWKTARFTKSQISSCNPFQRINHFPGTIEITRKDLLHRNMRKMKGIYGAIAEFVPESYVLPKDYSKFVFAYSEAPKGTLWIAKPHDLSRGRKIFVFTDLSELQYDQQYVVQRYLERPLLIDGFKFDLRLYVLVTSYRPLRAYFYKQGLARFSTERYSLDSKDKYIHLTNASINKLNPKMIDEEGNASGGYKWTFDDLFEHLDKHSICDREALWERIRSLISVTLLSIIDGIPPEASPCFELFGFDVILDDSLKPWLLEVNFSPSLNLDTETDHIVKKPLIRDTISVLNMVDFDKDVFLLPSKRTQTLPKSQVGTSQQSATGSVLSSTVVGMRRSLSAPRTTPSVRSRSTSHTSSATSPKHAPGALFSTSSSTSSSSSSVVSLASRKSEASIVQLQRDTKPTSSRNPVISGAEHGDLGDFEYLLPWDGASRDALQMCANGKSDQGVRLLIQMLRVREQAAISKNRAFARTSASNAAALLAAASISEQSNSNAGGMRRVFSCDSESDLESHEDGEYYHDAEDVE